MLKPGDERMHYSDGSHRWTAPPGTDQDTWTKVVQGHVEEHLASMGGDPPPAGRTTPPKSKRTGWQ